jgi:hypothetical protein
VEPENLNFGGGVAGSIVNPFVLIGVLIAGVLICILPRSKAIIPFLAAGILIPIDQVLVVGGLHFPMLRVLVLFGFVRIFWVKLSEKGEIFSGGMNGIDRAVIVLILFTTIDGVLLWQQSGALIKYLGDLYTAFGVYFLLRSLIRDQEDVKRALRVLACVTVAVAGLMMYEYITGRNLIYAVLGGARADIFSTAVNRNDSFRARGCFAHPILAGTFGGIMLPMFIGLWWREKSDRKYVVPGAIGATMMSFAAGSSTAAFGFIAGSVALCLWPLRRRMRVIRWSIVIILVSLHLVMKAPVWHLISRVDLSGGSSSYHRFELINQCILHFWDWVLIGTKDYANWGWDMWDLGNQYVWTADTVGLIPLIAFLAILVYGFKYLGRARRYCEGDRKQELFIWAIGASLFANVVAFFGIGYFDQIIVAWYALLAMISTVTAGLVSPTVIQAEFSSPYARLPGTPMGASGLNRNLPATGSARQTLRISQEADDRGVPGGPKRSYKLARRPL